MLKKSFQTNIVLYFDETFYPQIAEYLQCITKILIFLFLN